MTNFETDVIQIVLFLFFAAMFDPLLSRKIAEWF